MDLSEECNSFDVAIGTTQTMPSHHALYHDCGEYCTLHNYMYMYSGTSENRPPVLQKPPQRTKGRGAKLFPISLLYNIHGTRKLERVVKILGALSVYN